MHRSTARIALLSLSLATAFCPLPPTATAATPDEALKSFKLADGFEISLVAAEPDIRQPVAMNFDERGRLWVVQYLQYPDPAGLKKVKVDQYMRTRFDRVPEPPPRGPQGKDRITICEDTNGDGRADKFKDFVAGLNMATGVAVGYGGVFVAQSPYLLFYPDRNRNDSPDGDPQVLVAGFGMEDSHAYPNSLQIGPDGWLYGAQGSNVWAKVEVRVDEHGQTYSGSGVEGLGARDSGLGKNAEPRAPNPESRSLEFNQCIWRYHPPTGRFEVFAEGGGNTWGVDFDRHGEIIAGTNFGGVCGLHMVQGGYYVKGFAKHGPLSNPHAYGYFEHMPYASPAKISQGEHVMCGGIVYQGGAFGPEIENQYITCALLHGAIYWHKLIRDRSTYKSDFGGPLVTTEDREFRPVDLALAPDGSVYIADWADIRANHVIPEDTWNKTNGRIYRLAKKGTPRAEKFDLVKKTSAELVKLLEHPNAWHRREAVRLLGDRGDKNTIALTESMLVDSPNNRHALEALWARSRIGPFGGEKLLSLTRHENPDVRAWAIRIICDEEQDQFVGDGNLASAILKLAHAETSPRVRSQIASSMRRLRTNNLSISLLEAMVSHDEDADDPHIPLLLWWAVQSRHLATIGVGPICNYPLWLPPKPAFWQNSIVRRHLTLRLARWFADGKGGVELAGVLLSNAPTDADRELVLRGIDEAVTTVHSEKLSPEFSEQLSKLWAAGPPSPLLIRVSLKLGSREAFAEALRIAANDAAAAQDRIAMLDAIAPSVEKGDGDALLSIVAASKSEAVQLRALGTLSRIDDDAMANRLLASLETMKPVVRARTLSMLAARKSSAAMLLDAVAAKKIAAAEITTDLAHVIQQHGDPALTAALEKHVGKFSAQTSAEKQQQINHVAKLLAVASGDAARGKLLFAKTCGICHTLHGEGNKIGPDLTTADRGNRSYMLANVVDPNLGLRQEYAASTIRTVDGQILTGIVIERTDAGLTLVDAKNVQHRVASDEIDEMKAAEQSLMPEKVLDPLSETEVRDLFAYLEAGVPRTDNRRSIISTFDAGVDEFIVADNGDRNRPEHQATGGASGGFLVLRDSDGADMRLIAPLNYHGDLTPFTDGMAWFDAKTITINPTAHTGGQPHPVFGTLTISDGKTTLQQDLFHPTEQVPTKEWLRFSGRLTAQAFETDATTFATVMSNVTSVTITVEAFSNARETIGVDNFTLQAK
ncbi:MAG: PVC-type heme-binding CxxCH protein [Pirellulales bacterium]